jgi:hypothetical protein
MAKGAQLTDSSVLDRMRGELDRYQGATEQSIQGVIAEIQRTQSWLASRVSYWKAELERRERLRQEAERALERCLASSRDDRYDSGCSSEERALARAEAACREAQSELNNANNWLRRVETLSNTFANQARGFSGARAEAIATGKKLLSSKQQAIANYANAGGTGGMQPSLAAVPRLPSSENAVGESPGQAGKAFHDWCSEHVFIKEDAKLDEISLDADENSFLDTEQDAGLEKSRRFDTWLNDRGEIWELKAGYETSHIDRRQAEDYARMLGHGRIKLPNRGGEGTIGKKVNAVYYLFDSEAGARNNADILRGLKENLFICFIDPDGNLQQLK